MAPKKNYDDDFDEVFVDASDLENVDTLYGEIEFFTDASQDEALQMLIARTNEDTFLTDELGTIIGNRFEVMEDYSGDRTSVFTVREFPDGDHLSVLKYYNGNNPKTKREADILGAISHPNVVKLIDLLQVDDQPMMQMEHLTHSVRDVWQEEATSREAFGACIFDYLTQVAAGLEYVAREGFVHLDMKPTNVGMREGVYKIIDFGAAREDQAPIGKAVVGTPPFQAPEQYQIGGNSTSQCDVYALAMSTALVLHNFDRLISLGKSPGQIMDGIYETTQFGVLRSAHMGADNYVGVDLVATGEFRDEVLASLDDGCFGPGMYEILEKATTFEQSQRLGADELVEMLDFYGKRR